MRRILILLTFLVTSCNSNENCDTVTIDSSKQSANYSFECKVKNPFKMDYLAKLKFNDTIVLNGIKTPPMDTVIKGTPIDFYGGPPIILKYDRYKATKVEINYTYCFY